MPMPMQKGGRDARYGTSRGTDGAPNDIRPYYDLAVERKEAGMHESGSRAAKRPAQAGIREGSRAPLLPWEG
eukprot:360000-Chlamydomonas_euryale.AAC.1